MHVIAIFGPTGVGKTGVAIEVACAPDRVWAAVLEEYVEARNFREIGYAIDWLDEPSE